MPEPDFKSIRGLEFRTILARDIFTVEGIGRNISYIIKSNAKVMKKLAEVTPHERLRNASKARGGKWLGR